MVRLAQRAGVAAVVLAVLALPAYAIVASGARTLQAFVPFDEALVPVNQYEYGEDPTGAPADILAIYGTPLGTPEAYVFVDEAMLVRPAEDSALTWVKTVAGSEPIKLELVRAFVLRAALAVLAGGLGLLTVAWVVRRRRSRRGVAAAAPA